MDIEMPFLPSSFIRKKWIKSWKSWIKPYFHKAFFLSFVSVLFQFSSCNKIPGFPRSHLCPMSVFPQAATQYFSQSVDNISLRQLFLMDLFKSFTARKGKTRRCSKHATPLRPKRLKTPKKITGSKIGAIFWQNTSRVTSHENSKSGNKGILS